MNDLQKFFGGSPLSVLLKLAGLSIVVGMILHAIGFSPFRLLHSIQDLAEFLWYNAWNLFEGLWRYFALGAVIVFPVWLIVRFFARKQGSVRSE